MFVHIKDTQVSTMTIFLKLLKRTIFFRALFQTMDVGKYTNMLVCFVFYQLHLKYIYLTYPTYFKLKYLRSEQLFISSHSKN